MRPTPNDLSFTLFGFSTNIQPFFWLVAILITALHLGPIDNMPIWIAQILVGTAGVLLSILVHELGHALTFRHLFHTPCAIVLHGFGGAAIPLRHYPRGNGFLGMLANCFLSFSGPLAGFILAFCMITFLQVTPVEEKLFTFFLKWTALISIFWGIINLLPIYPMDGGQIARECFTFVSPRRGIEFSLIASMMLAALLAILALRFGQFFITLIFAYFAYQNYQELSGRSFRR